jgi:hypothetical protein
MGFSGLPAHKQLTNHIVQHVRKKTDHISNTKGQSIAFQRPPILSNIAVV